MNKIQDNDNFYNEAWHDWSEMIDNSPAPRHRRRLIYNQVKKLENINTIADIGCGNGAMILNLKKALNKIQYFGFDISSEIIERNDKNIPDCNWSVLDLSKNNINSSYDVIICSEVLEHIDKWENALAKLINATEKMCIITVPSGRIFQIDKMVGHYFHFDRKIIDKALKERNDIKYNVFYWGFPFHQVYKQLMNLFPGKTYKAFTKQKYGFKERLVSTILNLVFYLNFKTKFKTSQMFILIEKTI